MSYILYLLEKESYGDVLNDFFSDIFRVKSKPELKLERILSLHALLRDLFLIDQPSLLAQSIHIMEAKIPSLKLYSSKQKSLSYLILKILLHSRNLYY